MTASASPFLDLGIHRELSSALVKMSIVDPTPIQVAAIPVLLQGKDAYLRAETGTGKTLAYLLPLFSLIDLNVMNAQIIVVAPTHELSIQIQRQCTDLAQFSGMPIRSLLLIGGTSRDRQLEKLKKKPHVIIGSTGRIRELIEDGKLKTHQVRSIVIDEADGLLNSERLPELRSILNSTKPTRQLVFVSATEKPESAEVIKSLSPTVVHVHAAAAAVNPNIEHMYLVCEDRDKPNMVRKLLYALAATRSLIFVHRNEMAQLLAEKLTHHKVRVANIHSAHHKDTRKKAMDDIRGGKVDVLIASDVAARGLDIKKVSHVINFDLPSESDAYLHRIGRTGRAGEKGVAISLINDSQFRLVKRFQNQLSIEMIEVFLREGQVRKVDLAALKNVS